MACKEELFSKYPVISPNLITLDGVHQNPHVLHSVSPLREIIYDMYYSNYYLSIVMKKIANFLNTFTARKDYEYHTEAGLIYQGYGACYILTPVFIENFYLLDAPTFLMGEELFLTKQLEKKGFNVYYEPSIIVYHHDHASTGKVPSRYMWEICKTSHKVYRKYVNPFNSSRLLKLESNKIYAVVVSYNGLNSILESVERLQKYVSTVCIVDNGSNKETIELLNELEHQYTNVKVIKLYENMGIGFALNIGIREARIANAEWLLTMDQDSII